MASSVAVTMKCTHECTWSRHGLCPSDCPNRAIDFTAVTAALDAAHFDADDPVRRAVGGFDMAPVLDPEKAGY